jgi:hypothetical protein
MLICSQETGLGEGHKWCSMQGSLLTLPIKNNKNNNDNNDKNNKNDKFIDLSDASEKSCWGTAQRIVHDVLGNNSIDTL